MEELKKYIDELKEEIKNSKLKVSDDTVLDCAVRFVISNKISQERNRNSGYQEPREFDGKPTKKQRYVLEQMKVPDIDNITFEEAAKLIGEYKEKQQKDLKEKEMLY